MSESATPHDGPRTGDRPAMRKSLLICPSCDHQSPPDGDWQRQLQFRTTVYECPECGVEIARRPSHRRWRAVRSGVVTVSREVGSLWAGSVRQLARLFRV